jgi:beta-lactamase class A
MITRRWLTTGVCTVLAGYGARSVLRPLPDAHAASGLSEGLADEFSKIENQSGGRLGVAVLDTRTGAQAGHRADERFPMCSTFKLLAAAAILSRVDAGKERLDRRIHFKASDLVVYSPVTQDRVGDIGITLAELCEAAVTLSDNTAGNLLLANIGGPAGLTSFARTLGDAVTRLDRIEPDLNEALPGDERDTTSPAAMLSNIRAVALGDALSSTSREQLIAWLVGNKTGDTRLRAGLPKSWRVADKTGSGERGTANDAGLAWPPGRAPVIISVYLTGTLASAEQRNAAVAAVGRAVGMALDQ